MKFWTKGLSLSISTAIMLSTSLVHAKETKTNTAVMQAMDKVTGRVKVIEVPVNGNVDFGTFSVLVRDCQTRPPEETPENYAFVDIIDTNIDGSKENIFRGWMMSSTPALNAVEHPIYDVWLLKCTDTNVDTTKLLSSEQLTERNSISKKITEDTKLKEGFVDEEINSDAEPEKTPVIAEETSINEETQESIPEETIQEGVIESEIVVKGLTQDSPEPLQPLSDDTVENADNQQEMNNSDATNEENQNKEVVEDFYDEFDSLIE